MLTLTRKGNEVFYEDKKLVIIKQESKGPGKEQVKVENLPNTNGQKWVSLARLAEGENNVECKGREVTSSSRQYSLTEKEKEKIDKLQAQIDEIVNAAKARYVAKPKLDVDPTKMTKEEREAKIEEIRKFYAI